MCNSVFWFHLCKQRNLSITDTLGPYIFGHFCCNIEVFPLSEVKNVLVTPIGIKIFVLIMVIFSIVSALIGGFVIREDPLYFVAQSCGMEKYWIAKSLKEWCGDFAKYWQVAVNLPERSPVT